jgi:RNA polymerase sigma factor (sigma-70 family)
MNPGEQRLTLVENERPRGFDELSDDDLMLLVKAGRKEPFEAIIKRHQTLVFGFAARYMNDRQMGRDVAQDVFYALWDERERYQPRGKLTSFLIAMTRNRCQVILRQGRVRAKKNELLGPDEGQTSSRQAELPLATLVEAERAAYLQAELARLPDRTREVLILRFTNDLKLEEIADTMNLPLNTVKSHLFRGLKQLRQHLEVESP